MSAEVKTSITRPDIFHECKTCPIALDAVNKWLTFSPPINHIFARTTEIIITCSEEKEKVFFQDEFIQQTQYVEGGSVIDVPGGRVSPILVNCPHFQTR